jgi:sugar/nucleoside kinase (ribokinase family)
MGDPPTSFFCVIGRALTHNALIVLGCGANGALLYQRVDRSIFTHTPCLLHHGGVRNTVGAGDALYLPSFTNGLHHRNGRPLALQRALPVCGLEGRGHRRRRWISDVKEWQQLLNHAAIAGR